MQTCRVQRRHRQDLIFQGEILAQASERETDERLSQWMEVALYRTSVGKYMLVSNLHCDSNGAHKLSGCLSFHSPDDVEQFLHVEQVDHADVVRLLLERARNNTD
ncbi:MAG: hypothetical protein PWQ57_798 [Desulfovibrionales bacterium]|jgi:hypothetical protein|nr:hypothetical protein [Desulfovibrionales bacterium]